MNSGFEMFISFFKVGLFTFGGGYAMLPIAKAEIVEKKQWITFEELMDYYGIAQLSMGILAINTNTLVGYHIAKKKGATIAAVATALPSIIIIVLIAAFLTEYFNHPIVIDMFKAIRIVVTALIVSTTYDLAKKGIVDLFGIIMAITAFIAITFVNVNPIFLVVPSGILGIVFFKSQKEFK